jgi:hypothetical protein
MWKEFTIMGYKVLVKHYEYVASYIPTIRKGVNVSKMEIRKGKELVAQFDRGDMWGAGVAGIPKFIRERIIDILEVLL